MSKKANSLIHKKYVWSQRCSRLRIVLWLTPSCEGRTKTKPKMIALPLPPVVCSRGSKDTP